MGYLRLAKPPELTINLPDCGACEVEIVWVDDFLRCPSCGTEWDGAEEGVQGQLTSNATGPTCPNEWAWRVSHLAGDERDRAVASYVASHPSVNS